MYKRQAFFVVRLRSRPFCPLPVVSVFDISQTEGKELPALTYELTGNVEQYKDFFAALEKTSPFAMGFEALSGGVKGRCNYEEKRIIINEGMDELQNIKTAIHEICLLYTSPW